MLLRGFQNKPDNRKVSKKHFSIACIIVSALLLLVLYLHQSAFAALFVKPVQLRNVAALKTSDLSPGAYVETAGYYTKNDGGAGLYKIRTRHIGDIHNGGNIIITNNGNVAELITEGTINVKQFGAVGDGKTDDTEAFANAIVCAHENILSVPKGKFLIRRNLFADGVERVDDKGEYPYIKPVYPHTEPFVKDLYNVKFEGTLEFVSNVKEWPQGLGVDRKTGELLIAGVYNTTKAQTLYRVKGNTPSNLIGKNLYTTLGHTNTITHCPERGEYIVDDCSDANKVLNYAVINDRTMVADPLQKKLPFLHFGISWDPVCKLFVCHHQVNGNAVLRICDINFNLLRTVTIKPSGKITLMNGGCCYDSVFFAPCFTAFGEFSLLGEEIKLHTFRQTYELEDCDVINGVLYISGARKHNQVDIFSCDGSTKNYAKKSLATFLKQ